jgi:formylglycine-generating enzyme required for sulfatase activity
VAEKIDELQDYLSGGTLQNIWRKAPFTNSIGMRFVYVPPGTFTMGTPLKEDKREIDEIPHRVTISKGFYIGATEVTQGQWREIMGKNPSRFKGDNLPVGGVSWMNAFEFIKRLVRLERRRYRLPTEAEWEYACRAGTQTPFNTGETITPQQANFNGNYTYGGSDPGVFREKPTPVASFPPNQWGLYDVHGNLWEWCNDWYGAYSIKPVTDPRGPKTGNEKVLRGGAWILEPRICRSGNRSKLPPETENYLLGFRLVLEEKQKIGE